MLKNKIAQERNLKRKKVCNVLLPRNLIFKLQEEFAKFKDICVGCSSPKTVLEADFLNLKHLSLTSVFLIRNFLSKYLTFINLITYLFL